MKFGLENISRLCTALGNPQQHFAAVIVAGTNGKGSVTAMVHRALRAAGHRAGRYTSPHLQRLEERFVIGDDEVDTVRLRQAAGRVRAAIEELQHDHVLEAPPTFFECATAIAFDLFRESGVSIAVLEVGLGGRLDATNVVSPIAAAITSIGFDHQAQLGNTIESIAFEKAGVIKDGIPVVVGELPEAAQEVIARACVEHGARLIHARDCSASVRSAPLALPGRHQRSNAAVALCLLRQIDRLGFRVGEVSATLGLTDVQWPARLERLERGGTEFLLDAAHNPDGAAALAGYLAETGWRGAALVFGAMHDKAVPAMLEPLAAVCAAIVCTTPETARAMPAAEVAAIARDIPGARWTVAAVPDPSAAISHASRHFARVVVAGSIFLVGPVRGILRAR